MLKNLFLWVTIAILLISVFNNLDTQTTRSDNFAYSELVNRAKQGEVRSIVIHNDQSVTGKLQNDHAFVSYIPIKDAAFLNDLVEKGVIVKGEPPYRESFWKSLWMHLLFSWIPALLPIGIWVFFMRQMAGGSKGTFSFGRSRARLIGEDEVKVTFQDVAGVDEAKEEVSDLVDFLRDPARVQKLGGKIPRGVLLMGEPGTGKTLLAKAVAGEAKVPFFTISGADFVEMFVGIGASRVRDMFKQAKEHAPCIIFIDEIDAVGRHRGVGMGGGNDEREQTLNQLLVEMDGFVGSEGVIVIAATNRPDVLDKALMRPGRFDRQVVVNLPDIQGRYQILQIHLKKVKFDENTVDPLILARGTPGFSGADLENLVNEGALRASRFKQPVIGMSAFEWARDKIMMGAERSMIMNAEEKKVTAYHEAGHAIIGWHMIPKGHDPIHKVTIMPRGRALGLTMYLPQEDRYSDTKQRLESRLSSLFGGRLAEELIFGADQVTTGAYSDIQRATEIARNMVIKWGLSEVLGPLNYDKEHDELMNGRSTATGSIFSEETIQRIDQEVRAIIDRCYQIAKKTLEENLDILHKMADMLIQYETIDATQVEQLMQRKKPTEPKFSKISTKPKRTTNRSKAATIEKPPTEEEALTTQN
jgi:cell division protease FtsH